MTPAPNVLQSIKTFKQLVTYLRDELGWPIESESFDDLTFDYSADELGLDAATAVKIKEIKQLRPLSHNQPWGIFFVSFEPKRLPVVALRRILSTLVIRKRQSANKSQQAAWKLNDLLFISSYGESDHRDIAFAHFAEEHQFGDLPTLRVLGWDDEDTKLKLDYVHRELKEKLRWPDNEKDVNQWRATWSSAFRLRNREVIRTSQQLAERLAELARSIRKRANTVLAIESDKGPLRRLHAAFKEALIHDLSTDDFADMYAQTISYGLLTARVSRPSGIVADNLADMVPVTNPFLKELLETFLTVGGRKGKIDFDELGINEVVELLRDADMEAVLRDFGDRNPEEDPVIHFYELFLSKYDPDKRMERGVFYTPRPVVSFIVRSVHEILQKEFGLEDGLADTTTWGEMVQRHNGLQIPRGVSPETPFVQILDPATGTGTFLVECIELIRQAMELHWKKQGHMALEYERLWNDYVPAHLLPRLYGFELMMAPYAIAHMKIGLKLYETGYRFRSSERARVFLTNSLESASDERKQREFEDWSPALAQESKTVNDIKARQRFTVLIGNPPYSGISANMSAEAQDLVTPYKYVDGQPLNERKLWLQDDYVKFIRIAQNIVDSSGVGVLGYITNHGYLTNPTFRGMRRSLMHSFREIFLVDLHGNANKKERSPDGSEDANVFDIRQGVAIFVGTRGAMSTRVFHSDTWGSRSSKYKWLLSHSVGHQGAHTLLLPDAPFYFFVPQNVNRRAEYERGWKITELMPINSAGFITARDHFVMDFDRKKLLDRIRDFADPRLSDGQIRAKYFSGCGSKKYPDGDTRGWKVPDARFAVQKDKNWEQRIIRCLYRPFDFRFIYWADWMIDWPRPEVMGHMLSVPNIALLTARSNKASGTDHFFSSRLPTETKCAEYSTQSAVFPLFRTSDASVAQRRLNDSEVREPNLASAFLSQFAACLELSPGKNGLPEGITPEDILHYIYAVFHSPTYRTRYAEFLKSDFPRVPLPGALDVFRILTPFGCRLVELHTRSADPMERPDFNGLAVPVISKPVFVNGTVYVDNNRTAAFSPITEEVWKFHIGGYQVCEKWLKDRKGRTLSKADIEEYRDIVGALVETIHIMSKIDKAIEANGGWPGAFRAEPQASSKKASS